MLRKRRLLGCLVLLLPGLVLTWSPRTSRAYVEALWPLVFPPNVRKLNCIMKLWFTDTLPA